MRDRGTVPDNFSKFYSASHPALRTKHAIDVTCHTISRRTGPEIISELKEIAQTDGTVTVKVGTGIVCDIADTAAKGTAEVVAEIEQLAAGGSFGSIVGRNAFQRSKEDAVSLLEEIMDTYAAAA